MLVGHFCKLLGGPAGTQPTKELELASEVELSSEKSQIDATTRRNKKSKSYLSGLMDHTLSFTYKYEKEDEGFQLLKNAYYNGTPVALFAADDAGNGVDGDWEIFGLNRSEGDEDTVQYAVTAKPAFLPGENGREPAWVDKAS